MMRTRNFGLLSGIAVLAGSVCAPPACAASPASLSGGILGQVRSAAGVAQMGATVMLYDRYDQLVRRALTNADGKFAFDQLPPELYSIRVSLASFVPAIRRNIAVAAGSENLLQINLASLFSTVDLVSSGPSRGTLMSDDWKWVLRSSQATRPVLRLVPVSTPSHSGGGVASIFSDTSGVVKLSAGDGESFTSGSPQDLGTAFALETSLFGSNRVQLSGNVGYIGNSTVPATGFRTSYSRTADGGMGPQVTLTVRQIYLPNRGENTPALRMASLAMRDQLDLSDNLRLEYGLNTESVAFLHKVNIVSPFARATYDLGRNGAIAVAYSSGTQPTEFASREASGPESNALNQDLAALAQLPRVSRRGGDLQVQRDQNVELGYQIVDGSRTFSAGAYTESVSNAAFTMSAPLGLLPAGDALPDIGTSDLIFNAGSYTRTGISAGLKQSLGEHLQASVAAGRMGALAASGRNAAVTAEGIRGLIHEADRPWMTLALSGTAPRTGTFVATSYGWTDARVLMPDHLFLTQDMTQSTGWNVRVRQPLPVFSGVLGRLEATAELRNLLAQGYLPLTVGGQKTVLTSSPRAVRGGLAFIF